MDIYNLLADGLLEIESKNQDYFIWLNDSETNLSFGFQHKKNYSGLMTKISPKYIEKAKDKQGYFDILGITGIHRKIKHETLFKELLLYTTLEECKAVWRGIMPSIDQFDKKHSSLATLAILMFEQEVNFGNEIWQRNTRFAPDISNPKFKRPRDLLMGYINVAFIEGLNRLDDFKNKKGQLMPTNDTEVLKKYFYPLRNDEHAAALMTGTTLEKFNMAIFDKELNPYKFKHYNKK